MRKLFFLFVAFVATTCLWAEDFEVDGIYYNYLDDNNVAVTYKGSSYNNYSNEYSGEVIIPSTVTYNGTTYSVTSIGDDAFAGCPSLTSITIPNSVTSIGSLAFENCSSLTSVTIPNSVTSIGYGAFCDCSSLASVTIPNSVTSIGEGAFTGCSSLTSVTIPNSVTSIGGRAFSGTGIYNDESNWENNVLYISNCLIGAKESISGAYTIKKNTRLIAGSAFYGCSSLKSITIPNSVTSIGDYAFYNCSSLKSITIPNSVTSIGDHAFAGCSSLTAITIPNSVTSIGYAAFFGCSSLTSITIPESVTSIGHQAFNRTGIYNNKSNWEDNVLYIDNCLIEANTSISGAYTIKKNTQLIASSAFYGCSSLTSVTIPNSVTSIGYYAFHSCSSLTSITCLGTTPPTLGTDVFYGTTLPTVYIPDNTLSAYQTAWGNEYAFVNNENTLTLHVATPGTLADLIFDAGTRPALVAKLILTGTLNNADFTCMHGTMTSLVDVDLSGITNINGLNFNAKSKLVKIILPANLTSIGERAFENCSSLKSITIPNSVKWIGERAFMNCPSLTSVTIGNSVISIGAWTFYNCESLTKTNYTGDIAGWCNIKFADASSNPMYYSHNFYINDQEIYDLVIPNTVGSIHNSAFINCSSLDSVTIPNSVTSIGGGAFYNCEFLRTVICEAVEVPELGLNVFSNTDITEATLYVPEQSLDDYKAANQWKDFGRILPLEEAPSAVENTRLPIANGAKLLRDGQLLILKDNKVYTIMGAQIQ